MNSKNHMPDLKRSFVAAVTIIISHKVLNLRLSQTYEFVLCTMVGVRRTQYDASFKLKVIKYALENSNRSAARQFSVNERCVRRWAQQEERLRACSTKRKSFRGAKTGVHPALELELKTFVQEQRAEGFAVTSEIIQVKARELAREYGIRRADFKASRGWVDKFMRRQGFSLRRRTSIAQKMPADYEDKLVNFQRFVIRLRRANNYLLGQIGNADQTPVCFDLPQNYTINTKGARDVRIKTTGGEKQRCTVMLACTADGKKLPPYIILKRKTMPKNVVFPKGVIIRVQEKGWMNNELMLDWLKCVWFRRPGAMLNMKSMLVLDAFRGHLTEDVKSSLKRNKVDLVVIPGGMTSQLQPLDVSINKPFKANIRRQYNEWMSGNKHALTPQGRIKRAGLDVFVTWCLNAWNAIEGDMIVKSFKKCCISNALDGTEDDDLWSSGSEDEDYNADAEDKESDEETDASSLTNSTVASEAGSEHSEADDRHDGSTSSD